MNNLIHIEGDVVGGRYEIVGEIGQGGMQEVYLSFDRLLKRDVALKVPKGKSAEKRFKRSAILSAKINHSNVAKTLDYIEEGGRPYLIEELIKGCDLSQLLDDHVPRLDPYTVARVFHHLAKALSASHHAGVVHRDLKPSNIMIEGEERLDGVKITDFGIAKMAQKEIEGAVEGIAAGATTSQTALGALPYMAPEMIEELSSADKPADIWALGAIVYELLTGNRPFGKGYKAVPAIMSAKLPEIPDSFVRNPQYKTLIEELYGIIKECIVLDVAKRPTGDKLVKRCEKLCYSVNPKEYGIVETFDYGKHGFIRSLKDGKSVFFHIDSVYGPKRIKVGQKVWFSRYPGSPRSRAFPVVVAHDEADS